MDKIFTIGYGGKKPEGVLRLLQENKIELVVDVRISPRCGWNPTFSKEGLQKHLTAAGIDYTWIRELGNTTRSIDDIKLVDEETGLDLLKKQGDRYHRIALICSEKDAVRCHRSYIAGRLGVEVVHL